MKDKVQSLVDSVQSLWQGITKVKDSSIQQGNAPVSPVGQPTEGELLTAVLREEIPKPEEGGASMVKWRRWSSKKKDSKIERVLESWDKSYVSNLKVKEVFGKNNRE